MLRQTPPAHPDYPSLEQANQQIGESVLKINEKKRAAEESQLILQLQNDIVSKDVWAIPTLQLVVQACCAVVEQVEC
jgi:hypothetical protein